MSEKTYKLTENQLKGIITDAVTNVISQLDNIEIVKEDNSKNNGIKIEDFSPEQYEEAMKVMAANRGSGQIFDLPQDKTVMKKASHWDIGQTWNDD